MRGEMRVAEGNGIAARQGPRGERYRQTGKTPWKPLNNSYRQQKNHEYNHFNAPSTFSYRFAQQDCFSLSTRSLSSRW